MALPERDQEVLELLEAMMDLARRKGVQVLEHAGTKILLGPEPVPSVSKAVAQARAGLEALARQQNGLPPMASVADNERPPTGEALSESVQRAREAESGERELTDEEILYASSLGWPQ